MLKATVRLAMGRRLLAFFATASADGDPESPARVADELSPMAAALSRERMVDRFVAREATMPSILTSNTHFREFRVP